MRPNRLIQTWIRLASFGIVFLCVSTAHAWSHKEHIQLTRMAAEALVADVATPAAMKEWLKQAIPNLLDEAGEREFFLHGHVGAEPRGFEGILYYAVRPDVHAADDPPDKHVQPFNVHERLLHYLDVELFLSGNQKREYRPNLSGKPRLGDIPHDISDPRFVQAGFLPFRVEYCYKILVESIRDGRLGHSNRLLEDEEDSAPRWAAYLAHYLEDNTQPHHATVDYRSASYFPNSRKAPNVHVEMEYKMCDDDLLDHAGLRSEYWPIFMKELAGMRDPTVTDDLFKATNEISLSSYDGLPMIGQAAVKARVPVDGDKPDEINTELFFHQTGMFHGQTMMVMRMKAIQTAWAVRRVQRVWKQAWLEALRAG